jgi:hypothetical protein
MGFRPWAADRGLPSASALSAARGSSRALIQGVQLLDLAALFIIRSETLKGMLGKRGGTNHGGSPI